eukprot:TRINITY_DN30188_c0_g1_i1.p1 TRINITY_DN30188_c0_g1~~TRINITY_DN30188_c0_g1_i1.p1  ORF type:complete len:212 (+),score=36.94 TRINITY_DN30188_c0_g1_i1:135-770(+)
MTTGNCIRNSTLAEMLKASEKFRSEKIHERLVARANTVAAAAGVPAAARLSVPEDPLLRPRTETVPFTRDELDWLEACSLRHGSGLRRGEGKGDGVSAALGRLVDWANAEPPQNKKKLFLVVRCRRCSAGAKGGVKHDVDIQLLTRQWQWLENVRARSSHASVGKTLRIIVDFYMPLCQDDAAFEQKILNPVRATPKHSGYMGSDATVRGA